MEIVVIGGGYAGLRVVQSLAARNLQVTLIEPRPEHILRPRLVAAAAQRLALRDVSLPFGRLLPASVRHLRAAAIRFDPDTIEVETDREAIRADRLVLAMGAESNPTIPGVERHGLPVYSLEDLQQVLGYWSRLEEDFKRDRCDPEALRWVIVGGGMTGVMLAAELVHLARRWRRRYGSLAETIQIHLVQRSERLLPGWTPEVGDWAMRWLIRHRVIVQLNTQVRRARPDLLVLAGPDGTTELATQRFLWAGGTRPVRLEEEPEGLRTPEGFVQVDAFCRLVDHPRTYAVGDLIQPFNPRTQQSFAPNTQLAVRAAEAVALNLVAESLGRAPVPFTPSDERVAFSLGAFDGIALVDNQELVGTAGWTAAQAADLLYVNSIQASPLIGRFAPELAALPQVLLEAGREDEL